jgi:hypothetical protein
MDLTYQGRNALRLASADWQEGSEFPLSCLVWVALVRKGYAERDRRPSRMNGEPDCWWYRLTDAGLQAQRRVLDRDQAARVCAAVPHMTLQ